MKISVCMATYNGRQYIAGQIESVRSQLGPADEIIVNDDGSTDGTVEYLASLGDARIKLERNAQRLGHVRNFAASARRATGDVIFFSDQDDHWAPNKVETVVEIFKRHPQITFVHHGLRFVDAKGQPTGRAFLPFLEGPQQASAFLARQMIRGQVFGCASAVRGSSLKFCLPFPESVYAHDHWFAIAHAICGRIYMIDQPLIDYRQHEGNVTPKLAVGLDRKIKWRLASAQQIREARRRRGTATIETAPSLATTAAR